MFGNDQLEYILELLNLEIDDSKKFIIDSKGNQIRIIRDERDRASFRVGDMAFSISKESITIDICEKSIEISNDEFYYQRKKPDTLHNAITFRLYGNKIFFYRSDDENNTKLSLICDSNGIYSGMTKSFSMIDRKDGFTIKNNSEYKIDKTSNKKITTISKYDESGKNVNSSRESIDIKQPIYSLVEEEVAENTLIPCIIDELEETIPGLVKYLGTRNSKIDEIAKIVKNQQKK